MREQYTTRNHEFAPAPISTTPTSALVREDPFPVIRRHPFHSALYEAAKKGFDLTVAGALIVGMLPLFIFIAVAVKLTSRGPVFFRHRRLGYAGREFDCLKFRTMVSNAEDLLTTDPQLRRQFDQKFKIDDDPRVTTIGKFLRCTSLDELPQLFNVVQGKMSLIGPRPIIDREREKYSIYFRKLVSVKPGMSGLWQVSGRSDTTYSERVLLDMYYIDHRGPLLDMKIFFRTFRAVLRKTGAC